MTTGHETPGCRAPNQVAMDSGQGDTAGIYGRDTFCANDEPTFSYEIEVVTGQEGAELQVAQANALKELLEWLVRRRTEPRKVA